MTTGCRRTREIAAELALGIAEGQQRAEALDHLATCAACRAEVDQLTATADSLLLTAPRAEPPAGFETTVLRGLDGPPTASPIPLHRRPRVVVGIAAAAVVVLFVIGIGIGRVSAGPQGAGADQVAVGAFTSDGGSPVGAVRAVSGDPSWLLVTIPGPGASPPLPPGDYQVECRYRNGYEYHAGTLTIDPDEPVAAWSTTVGYPLDDLDEVRLVGADGTALVATLQHPS